MTVGTLRLTVTKVDVEDLYAGQWEEAGGWGELVWYYTVQTFSISRALVEMAWALRSWKLSTGTVLWPSSTAAGTGTGTGAGADTGAGTGTDTVTASSFSPSGGWVSSWGGWRG